MKTHVVTLIFLFILPSAFARLVDSTDFYLEKGLQYRQERRWQQAINYLEKAVTLDSNNLQALTAFAEVAMETRYFNHALKAYHRIYALQPDNEQAIRQLTQLYFNLGRYKDALQYIEIWEKQHRDQPMHYMAGMSLYYLENYPYAINRLLYAAEKDSTNAQLFYTIGRSYLEMERYKQAIPYYRKAANLDTANARYVYEMAMVYYAIPDDRAAIGAFEEAAARGWKQEADFFESMAYCYMNLKNFDKAITLFKQSLEIKPYNQTVQFALAEAQYHAGAYKEAIDSWDKLLQIDQNNARALYMIGMAYQKMGQKDKGMLLCDKAIEMDPSLSSLKQKKMNIGM